MRKLAFILVLCLAGCATGSIQNPITNVDMFRVKSTYAATVEIAIAWRTYCFAKTYAVLMADPVSKPVCTNRRQTLRTIQSADSKAYSAITYADNFVKKNPTLSLTSAIGPAWDAVTLFQQAVPKVN